MSNLRALVISSFLTLPAVHAANETPELHTYHCNQSYGRADNNFNVVVNTMRQVEDVTVVSMGNHFIYEGGLDSPELHPTKVPGYTAAIYGTVRFVKIDTEQDGVMFAMVDREEHVAVQAFNCKPQAKH